MEKSRKRKELSYYLATLLGDKGQRLVAKYLSLMGTRHEAVRFPRDIYTAKRILFIIPAEPLAALHQVYTVVSLISFFKNDTSPFP